MSSIDVFVRRSIDDDQQSWTRVINWPDSRPCSRCTRPDPSQKYEIGPDR